MPTSRQNIEIKSELPNRIKEGCGSVEFVWLVHCDARNFKAQFRLFHPRKSGEGWEKYLRHFSIYLTSDILAVRSRCTGWEIQRILPAIFGGVGAICPVAIVLRVEWTCTIFEEDMDQSSALRCMFYISDILLHFETIQRFKCDCVQNQGQISHFLTPVKITGGMGEMSFSSATSTTQPCTDILLTGRRPAVWEMSLDSFKKVQR